jgi:hypothetical protein
VHGRRQLQADTGHEQVGQYPDSTLAMKAERASMPSKMLGSNLRIGITIAAYLLLNSSLVSTY